MDFMNDYGIIISASVAVILLSLMRYIWRKTKNVPFDQMRASFDRNIEKIAGVLFVAMIGFFGLMTFLIMKVPTGTNSGAGAPAPVPEPTTLLLFLIGIICIKKRSKNKNKEDDES